MNLLLQLVIAMTAVVMLSLAGCGGGSDSSSSSATGDNAQITSSVTTSAVLTTQ